MRLANDESMYTGSGADWSHFIFGQGSWHAPAQTPDPKYFIFEVHGPESILVLENVIGESLRELEFNHSRPAQIGDAHVRVDIGISGDLGYEMHGPGEHPDAVWAAVVEAGKEYDIKQLGVRSRLVQYIESGFD